MDINREFVPRGVACHPLGNQPDPDPETIAFVLVPQLSMLAFSSAIEPLRIANQLTGKLLYRWQVLSETGTGVMCSNGVEISVDGAARDIDRKTMLFVCSGLEPHRSTSPTISGLVRRHWRMNGVVGGLCTGTYALARAGILKGAQFTLHWENIVPFREIYPDLDPSEQIYAIDRRIITCGGGTSSSDMFLTLIADRHGTALARAVADMCLKPVQRGHSDAQKSSIAAEIGTRNPTLLGIVEKINRDLDSELSLKAISAEFGISQRQVERLFNRYMAVSPRQYIINAQLMRARAMLSETNMTTAEIADAVGFNSASYFSKKFREKFGVDPKSI